MHKDMEKILLSEEQIQEKVNELAATLAEEYADKDPVFVGVLKGVVVFFADMMKRVNIPSQIDFMWISSYKGTTSSEMVVKRDVSCNLEGRNISPLSNPLPTLSRAGIRS